VRLMNFISAVFSLLTSLCFNVQMSQPYKSDGPAKILYAFKSRLSLYAHLKWTRNTVQIHSILELKNYTNNVVGTTTFTAKFNFMGHHYDSDFPQQIKTKTNYSIFMNILKAVISASFKTDKETTLINSCILGVLENWNNTQY